MMYQVKWIEGENNLNDFCQKCFKADPQFIENIGHCGPATIHKLYIYRPDNDAYSQMFLLFMEHERGTFSYDQIEKLKELTYEQIRTDKTAILVR